MGPPVVYFDQTTAEIVVSHLQRHYPEAKVERVPRGFGVSVSPGRFLIVDQDDWHSDRKTIIRGIIAKAKKGDLEATKFLLEHSNFKFPDFKVNGDEEGLVD